MKRSRRVFVVAAAAGLLFAACGGDDDSAEDTQAPVESEAPVTEPAATAAPTEAPVTEPAVTEPAVTEPAVTEPAAPAKSPVMVVGTVDISGPSPSDPQTIKVIEAWAQHVNAAGGINGHPVELDIQDTKGDAAVAQSLTEELLAKDPVLFFIVSASTETAQAATLAQAEVPVMGVGYNPSVWGAYIEAFKLACSPDEGAPLPCGIPNAFAVTTTFGAVVDEQIFGALAAGATKVAVAACAEVDSCSAAGPVFSATAAAQGLTDAGSTKVSSTATDYSAECIQWIQDGVDFIQISGGSAMGVNLIASCKDQGYEGIWGASAGSVSGPLIQVEDITMAGGLNAFPWWVDDPAVQEYRDAMEAGGVDEEGWSSPTATGIWSALQLFAAAQAELGDEPTGAETLANMYTLDGETLGGLIAPATFVEGDVITRHRPCFWPYILTDGVFDAPLGGLTYQCNPAEA